MMLKRLFANILCLTFAGGIITNSTAHTPGAFAGSVNRFSYKYHPDGTGYSTRAPGNDYQTDVDRLIALRSHPVDELLTLAVQLERKWRRINWNQYALIMT